MFRGQIYSVSNSQYICSLQFCHLFTNFPQPGDNEETFSVFESSCRLILLVQPLKGRGNLVKPKSTKANLPAYLHTILLMLSFKQGSWEYQLLESVGLTRPYIEPGSILCKACFPQENVFYKPIKINLHRIRFNRTFILLKFH